MHSSSSLVLLVYGVGAFASALFPRAACNADNCLRAVTGTAPGQTQTAANRIGDCSSFLLATVTPDTVTVTATSTVTLSTTTTGTVVSSVTDTDSITATTTVTTFVPAPLKKRDAITVSPSNIPAYASPCSGAVRYSSACSCAGVTASTTTVAAPTVTITSTISVTDISSTTTTIFTTATTVSDIVTTTTSTIIETCPAQVVSNGGFESGSLSPFSFTSYTSLFGGQSSIAIEDDPTNAHSGSYYAEIFSENGEDMNWDLSQTVSVCPGAPYELTFNTASSCPSAGACSCTLRVCVGSSCTNFDPPGGNFIGAEVSLGYTGSATGTDTLSVTVDGEYGIALCERSWVKFDDFALTLN